MSTRSEIWNGDHSPHAEHRETVIIGAGQAGLSTAYHLLKRGRPCLILDANDRVGDVWRRRFDSLRLYSPARFDGLPGMSFPADPWSFPTKDEVAAYLEEYATRFRLPVRTGVSVQRMTRDGDGFLISSESGDWHADNVVIATGTFATPRIPAFAADLDPGICQVHSAGYHNPSQLQPGTVLVVGASHSGADVAHEVAGAGHRTILCGPHRGEIPFIDGRGARFVWPVMRFAALHILTERTPLGRKMRPEVRSTGGPLLRVKRTDLDAAGVERIEEKVVRTQDGRPVLADGRVLDVANVVWCTGFGKDISWISPPLVATDGWPDQRRGVVPSSPGLYVVGLPFLYSFSSMLLVGVGRDAARVAAHIDERMASRGLATRREDAVSARINTP